MIHGDIAIVDFSEYTLGDVMIPLFAEGYVPGVLLVSPEFAECALCEIQAGIETKRAAGYTFIVLDSRDLPDLANDAVPMHPACRARNDQVLAEHR